MLGSCAPARHLALAGLVAAAVAVAPLAAPAPGFLVVAAAAASASPDSCGLLLSTRLELVGIVFGRLVVVLVGLQQIGGMEKRALLLPDVHERGLYSGEDGVDPSEVDVADGAAVIGAVDEELDQPIIFQDRQARFALAPVDEDLALHERTSAAPTCLPLRLFRPLRQRDTACARLGGASPLTGGTAPNIRPPAPDRRGGRQHERYTPTVQPDWPAGDRWCRAARLSKGKMSNRLGQYQPFTTSPRMCRAMTSR